MRLLSQLIQQQTKESHFFVEWDEPGRPHSIVHSKDIQGSVEEIRKGDVVEVKFGRSLYSAIILGYGKSYIYIIIYVRYSVKITIIFI